MLMIRLRPKGKRGQRSYALIVNEKTKDVFGDYLEQVGTYDPNPTPARMVLKEDRIKYWISKGAQVSETVHNILVDAKVIEGKKVNKGPVPKKEEPKVEEVKAEEKPAEQPVAEPVAEAQPEAAPAAEEKKAE